jgi:hypothetical protein
MVSEHADELSTVLATLREALAPVIRDRIAAAERAGRLVSGDAHRAVGKDPIAAEPFDSWDLASLLRVMFLSWNAAFRDGFSPNDRSAVSTLRSVADRHARAATLSTTEIARALTVASALIAALGAGPPVLPAPPSPAGPRPPTTAREPAATPAALPPEPTAPMPNSATDAAERSFRIVCWMKPEEAKLIADTYTKREDGEVTTSSETIVGARWYGPDHPDAIKYRAAVCMLRYGRSKAREPRQLWIREEEARAVLDAYSRRATVDYSHLKHGDGGRAIFHPDDSADVQRYLANVMLTRWR